MTAASTRFVPRNSPCPCGSGKRFKACHGASTADAAAGALPPVRPPSAVRAGAFAAQALREDSIVVFCRRAVNWEAPDYADRPSHFNQAHPLGRLQSAWREQNPGTPFRDYRLFLHRLARQTWEATGAVVVLNPVAMDHDARMAPGILMHLRRAAWIIPIDDDDWLAPGLAADLRAVPAAAVAATWNSLPLHVRNGHCYTEVARPYVSASAAAHERVLLSCAYAIHGRRAARLTDTEFAGALLHHGVASGALTSGALPVHPLDGIGSIHLRHQATAGSATSAEGRRLYSFVAPAGLADLAPWALRPLAELQSLHAARSSGA